jgi:hypothetical protein
VSSSTTLVDGEVINTIKEMCIDAALWKQRLAAINVVDDTEYYTLTLLTTDGTPKLEWVDYVKWKEDGEADDQFRTLMPITEDSQEYPLLGVSGNFFFTEDEDPTHYWVENDKRLRLHPIPGTDQAGTGNLLVAVVVSIDYASTTCPQFFYDDWREMIAWGAAARICRQAAYKWYDPKLAEYYQGLYMEKMNDLIDIRYHGRNRTPGIMSINPAFTGGSRQGSDWTLGQ